MPKKVVTRIDVWRYAAGRTVLSVCVTVPMTAVVWLAYHGLDCMKSPLWRSEFAFAACATAANAFLLTPLIALRGALTQRRLNELQAQLETLASLDALTGLVNRRGLEKGVASIPVGLRLAVILADLDHFKRINDAHGHEAGDAVLRVVGGLVRELTAPYADAIAARYGGEEIVVVLPNATLEAGWALAEKVRTRLSGQALILPSGPQRVTISLGVCAVPSYMGDFSTLLSRADAALYRAKKIGRNQVCSADDPPTAAVA